MTEKLQKAFEAAARLPKPEQDALATWLLAELADERRWQDTLNSTQDRLGEFAREAREEYRTGTTKDLDPEES